MLKALRKRIDERKDEGFTLIELMVVVLIIGILVAIAVPSFLGARDRANNRAAQTNVTTALKAEKTFFVDSQTYTEDIAAGGALESIAPELTYLAPASTPTDADAPQNEVYVNRTASGVGVPEMVVVAAESASGTVYCIGDIGTGATAGTYYTTACAGTEDAAGVAAWPNNPDAGW